MTSDSCWPALPPISTLHLLDGFWVWNLLHVHCSCYRQGARTDEGKVEDVCLALSLQFPREVTRCLCGTGRVGVLRVQATG